MDDELRRAFKLCGLSFGGRYIITTAYDPRTRDLGYQAQRLRDPEAATHKYDPMPGTFALHPADAALACLRIHEAVRALAESAA